MRWRGIVAVPLLACLSCEAEIIEEDDPNAAYRERYGDNYQPRTTDEFCEAVTYKVDLAACPSTEKDCQSAWRRSDEIPDLCWPLVYEAWDCTLEATWNMCVEQVCQDYYLAMQQCLTDNGYFGTTSATTGGSDPSGGGGGSSNDGAGGRF